MKRPSDPAVPVWRIPIGWRIAGLVIWIGSLAAIAGITAWSGWQGGLVFVGLMGLMDYLVWRSLFVPFVALMPDELSVQNRIASTTVPYSDISDVSGGFNGLRITLKHGAIVTAWAVQKSNAARWLGTQTRADDVGDAIMARVSLVETKPSTRDS